MKGGDRPDRTRLDGTAIEAALGGLAGWTIAPDALGIEKRFVFRNFSEAFGFMARCALAAETMDHHPDWSNVYKTVDIRLTTHDAGGVTALDIELARRIDSYAA